MSPIRFRVNEVREARGMSQAELARVAGVARSTLVRIEKQETTAIDLVVLERLADALDVDATMLIAHDRKPKRRG